MLQLLELRAVLIVALCCSHSHGLAALVLRVSFARRLTRRELAQLTSCALVLSHGVIPPWDMATTLVGTLHVARPPSGVIPPLGYAVGMKSCQCPMRFYGVLLQRYLVHAILTLASPSRGAFNQRCYFTAGYDMVVGDVLPGGRGAGCSSSTSSSTAGCLPLTLCLGLGVNFSLGKLYAMPFYHGEGSMLLRRHVVLCLMSVICSIPSLA